MRATSRPQSRLRAKVAAFTGMAVIATSLTIGATAASAAPSNIDTPTITWTVADNGITVTNAKAQYLPGTIGPDAYLSMPKNPLIGFAEDLFLTDGINTTSVTWEPTNRSLASAPKGESTFTTQGTATVGASTITVNANLRIQNNYAQWHFQFDGGSPDIRAEIHSVLYSFQNFVVSDHPTANTMVTYANNGTFGGTAAVAYKATGDNVTMSAIYMQPSSNEIEPQVIAADTSSDLTVTAATADHTRFGNLRVVAYLKDLVGDLDNSFGQVLLPQSGLEMELSDPLVVEPGEPVDQVLELFLPFAPHSLATHRRDFDNSVEAGNLIVVGLPAGVTVESIEYRGPNTGALVRTFIREITLSGTAAPGTYPIHVISTTAADTLISFTNTVDLVIEEPIAPANPAGTLDDGIVGATYSGAVSSATGTGPITYAVTAGALPAGLTLNTATGAITGTPTVAGEATFTITATGKTGLTSNQQFTVTVNPAPTAPVLPSSNLTDGTVNVGYNASIAATSGTGPFTYAVTDGSLPAGLTLNPATGAITGTPTVAGEATFTITATGPTGLTGSQQYSITVDPAIAPSLPANSLPGGAVDSAYSGTVGATGTGPITYAVTDGSLPAGLTLNPATGAITGTPTVAGEATFTVTATGPGGTASQQYAITVSANLVSPALPGNNLDKGILGKEYNGNVGASGTGPFTYAISDGTLPEGLTLNPATGAITGTPKKAGSFTFSVTVTGPGGTATGVYTLQIDPTLTNGGGSLSSTGASGVTALVTLSLLLIGAGASAVGYRVTSRRNIVGRP